MEYQLLKEKIVVSTNAFTGCKEQPVDIDLSLPDYCPDVRRVLKCRICPQVNSTSINGDTLEIDGSAAVSILYTDAQCCSVRCYEHVLPFSTVMNIKNAPSDYVVYTTTSTEYINCRALTPRRLDLHGAFSICAKVCAKAEKEIVCEIEGDDAQQRLREVDYCTLAGMGQQPASIAEITPLSQGKPPIQSVLKKDLSACVNEVKLLAGKAMVKGEICIRLLYLGDIEQGTSEQFEYIVPFSRVLDIDGIDEDCVCSVRCDINGYTISYDQNDNNISSDIKITLTLMGYRNGTVKCVSDAYSTKYDMQVSSSQVFIPGKCVQVSDSVIEKSTLDFGDRQINSVTDIWADNVMLTLEHSDEGYFLRGKLPINIIASGEDNELFFTERALDFIYPLKAEQEFNDKASGLSADVVASLNSLSYRLNGGDSVELRADLKLDGVMFCDNAVDYIASAECDEDKENVRDNAGIILYYAEKGESLWNIAKKYKTTLKSIADENDLSDDAYADGGLLVLPI